MVAIAMATLFSANVVNAQMMNDVNLESYAKAQYGSKWTDAALVMSNDTELNADGGLTLTKTIEAPGMTKTDLYYEMAEWFICNYQNAIQLADKEDGIIIARPYVSDIAESSTGWNAYKIDICPTIRVKCEDGLVMVDYSLKDYGVATNVGGGTACAATVCGLAVAAVATDIALDSKHDHHETIIERHGHHGHTTIIERTYRPHHHHDLSDALLVACIADAMSSNNKYDDAHTVWNINNCYPFVAKDSHKKASAKAFVMANTYSQVVMNNIEAAIGECQMAYNK